MGRDTVIAIGDGDTLTLRGVSALSLKGRDFGLPATAEPDAPQPPAETPAEPDAPDRPEPPDEPVDNGRTLTFSEEFSSLSATPRGDSDSWKTTLGIFKQDRTIASNKEAEFYSDSTVGVNPFSVSNGILSIEAAPTDPSTNPLHLPYTSGILTIARSFSQTYGYFEARMKMPEGQGFWPAFWLLPEDGSWPPEIDVIEVHGHNTTNAHVTVHSTVRGHSQKGFDIRVDDMSEDFHVFGVNWQSDKIEWFIDGKEVAQVATPPEMHSPMYMLVNLAVGNTGSWPGKYDASEPTVELQVDYVRAWRTDEVLG